MKLLLLMFYMSFKMYTEFGWPLVVPGSLIDITADWDGPVVIKELSASSMVRYIENGLGSPYNGVIASNTAIVELTVSGYGPVVTTVPEAYISGLGLGIGEQITVNCQSQWNGSLPINVATTLRALVTWGDDPAVLALFPAPNVPNLTECTCWLTIGFELQPTFRTKKIA